MGRTPLLVQRGRHRDEVSAAAALTLSPGRGHVRLLYQTYPDAFVDCETYALFLRQLLRTVRGPLVLVHDRGNMHHGPPVRAVCAGFPRLRLHELPPYAPELNPVEYAWNWGKDKQLCNFVPHDVPELDAAVCECLEDTRHDQQRLRTFFESSPLPWQGTRFI